MLVKLIVVRSPRQNGFAGVERGIEMILDT
jgi:hypothetical protein